MSRDEEQERVIEAAVRMTAEYGAEHAIQVARQMEVRDGKVPLRERVFWRMVAESIADATRCAVCAVPLDGNNQCPKCHVDHSEPCPKCGRPGYHGDGCSEVG